MNETDACLPLEWQSWIPQPYTAQLLGWPELPAAERIAAVVRFVTHLERALGGAAAVERAFWQDFAKLEELGHSSKRVVASSSSWALAEAQASAAGFEGLTPPKTAVIWLSMFDGVFARPSTGG